MCVVPFFFVCVVDFFGSFFFVSPLFRVPQEWAVGRAHLLQGSQADDQGKRYSQGDLKSVEFRKGE
ncbi:hypothetical protein P175DRAFT_0501036 [Aspergillus ochraceoroseus IBT 24754]|uniref:Uncharacterized protein n=1 Tax=Aspergillus ochraceoroseus IBT 24754 TaxID=1392256 RepID=A0A2T5M0W8_9EURO|nr:uncharacterized protein P175DRAFT_0501036 [Aspergillus ochraceoroseus IBT 24754]PTU22184.1 hypothetical protein P175DRAFT_0501036 [Aspergillus ochraceoroseus IBT 24754]